MALLEEEAVRFGSRSSTASTSPLPTLGRALGGCSMTVFGANSPLFATE
jgi:hypothetical protein